MPSGFKNYLEGKVIGACLYETYFNKEYMYSAKMAKSNYQPLITSRI